MGRDELARLCSVSELRQKEDALASSIRPVPKAAQRSPGTLLRRASKCGNWRSISGRPITTKIRQLQHEQDEPT